MPTGTYTVNKVPQKNLAVVVAGFKAQGASVTVVDADGKRNDLAKKPPYTVIARFPG